MITEELINSMAKPSDIVLPIFDTIWDKANNDFQGDILSLPLPLRTFQLVVILQGEVDNGSFDAWMMHCEKYAVEIPDALRLIGAVKIAALAEEVNQLWFEKFKHFEENKKWEEYEEEWTDYFGDVSEKFYQLNSGADHSSIGEEHLDTLLVQYVCKHKKAFETL